MNKLPISLMIVLVACPFNPSGITDPVTDTSSLTENNPSSGGPQTSNPSTGEDSISSSGVEPTTTSQTDITTSDISTSMSTEYVSTSIETGATSTSSNDFPPELCGNGNVDQGEECDDGIDQECLNCFQNRYIFVTSTKYTPYQISNIGAKTICFNHAKSANILTYGFLPILSFNDVDALGSINFANGRYLNMQNKVFADNSEDIITNNIINPPSYNEFGASAVSEVWTGGILNNNENCQDFSYSGADMTGKTGQSDSINNWLEMDVSKCDQALPIYCIQGLQWWDEI